MPVEQRLLKMNQYKAEQKIQDALYEITKKEPAALNEDERAFLRARRTYLSPEEKETYKEILSAKSEVDEDPVESLMKKTRKDLDTLAEELGLNPKDYENKEQVAKAIAEQSE